MPCKLISVGKLKEAYYEAACADYAKRVSRCCALTLCEVADERIPESFSAAETQRAMEREGERILAKIAPSDFVVALAIGGQRMSSESFSAHLGRLLDQGACVTFVIGGSAGLSDTVLRRANERLSLSDLTLPHRLARLVLLEQLYRAFKILRGEPYHK